MTNHPNRRGRGDSGYVPKPSEILAKRDKLTQGEAASLIFTTERIWRSYEGGNSRMHPASWELFCFKAPEANRLKLEAKANDFQK